MIGVLKLRRPRGGVTPSSFALPTQPNQEIKVGRNGDECDEFLYVDEHPSFLSRLHAKFTFHSQSGELATKSPSTVSQATSSSREDGKVDPAEDVEDLEQEHKKKERKKRQTPDKVEQGAVKTRKRLATSRRRGEMTPVQGLERLSDNEDAGSLTEDNVEEDELEDVSYWEVIDNSSVNGVFVNGDKLEANKAHRLKPGDRVFFGNPQHSFFLEYEFVVIPKSTKEAKYYEKMSLRNRSKKRRRPRRNQSTTTPTTSANAQGGSLMHHRQVQSVQFPPFDPFMHGAFFTSAGAPQLAFPPGAGQLPFNTVHNMLYRSPSPLSMLMNANDAQQLTPNDLMTLGGGSTSDDVEKTVMDTRSRKRRRVEISNRRVVPLESAVVDSLEQQLSSEGDNLAKRRRVCPSKEQEVDGMVQVVDFVERRQGSGQAVCRLLDVMEGDLWMPMCAFLDLPEAFGLRMVSRRVKNEMDVYLQTISKLRWSHQWVQSAMQHVLRFCSNLKTIDASGCYNMTDNEVMMIASMVPKVENLDLSGCSRISSRSISELSLHCTSIRSLRLRACKRIAQQDAAANLCKLAAQCKDLEHLDLRCCNMDDGPLIHVLDKCENLKTLDIGSTGFASVSNNVLHTLARKCTKLESLGVMCCRNIKDVGIEAVAKGCGSTLRYLTVHCCFDLTDRSLVCLARYCKQLESLNIHRCLKITDSGIESLVQGGCGSSLQSLDVSACRITDIAVNAIADNCPNLRVLDLRSCELITSDSIVNIATKCKRLEQIDLSCCKELDDRAILALAEHSKHLEQIEFGKGFNISKHAYEVLVKALGPNANIYF